MSDQKQPQNLLYGACCSGDVTSVKKLLAKGENPNVLCPYYSPLHAASASGHLAVVKALIDGHADVNLSNSDRKSPIYLACEFHQLAVVNYLIECGASVECEHWSIPPLHIACYDENGRADLVKLLVSKGANVNWRQSQFSKTALHIACELGHYYQTVVLVEQGKAFVDATTFGGRTPLHLACQCDALALVQYLVVKGHANVDKADDTKVTPLHLACKRGYVGITKFLLTTGNANMNCITQDGQNSLIIACENGFSEIVALLLEHNININCMDYTRRTGLWMACVNGYTEIAKMLLEAKASFIVPDNPWGCATPKSIIRLILGPYISFLCGHHRRCGAKSILQEAPHDILVNNSITSFTTHFHSSP